MSTSDDDNNNAGGGRRALLASTAHVPLVGGAGPLPVLPPSALSAAMSIFDVDDRVVVGTRSGSESSGDEEGDWTPRAVAAAAEPARLGTLELLCGPMFSGKSTGLLNRFRVHRAAGLRCALITYAGSARALTAEQSARRPDSPPDERARLVRTHDGDDELSTIACTNLADDPRVAAALRCCDYVFIDELQLFLKPTDGSREVYGHLKDYAEHDASGSSGFAAYALRTAFEVAMRELTARVESRGPLPPAVAVLAEAARAHGTHVVAAALSSDSEMRPFYGVPEFEALCDAVQRLAAPRCGYPLGCARPAPFTMRINDDDAPAAPPEEGGARPTRYLVGGAATYRAVCRAHHPCSGRGLPQQQQQ